MSLTSAFKTDSKLEREGVDVQIAANEELPESDPRYWITVRLCRAGRMNPDYQKVAERVMRPYRRQQELGTLNQKRNNELTMEIFSEAGIVGWQHLPKGDVTGDPKDSKNDKGELVFESYSKANAMSLFKNLPELYDKLIGLSVDSATFTEGNVEEDAKNSVRS